jgi:hypothetical protein
MARRFREGADCRAGRRCALRLPADSLSPGVAQPWRPAGLSGEPGHVPAGPGDDHLGGAPPDPRDGGQPGDEGRRTARPPRHHVSNSPILAVR